MGVFDKFKQGVDSVGAKSKEVMSSSKVKREIDGLKKQKREALEEIGVTVHEMCSNNNLDEEILKEKCLFVTALENKINEKETELEEIGQKE